MIRMKRKIGVDGSSNKSVSSMQLRSKRMWVINYVVLSDNSSNRGDKDE